MDLKEKMDWEKGVKREQSLAPLNQAIELFTAMLEDNIEPFKLPKGTKPFGYPHLTDTSSGKSRYEIMGSLVRSHLMEADRLDPTLTTPVVPKNKSPEEMKPQAFNVLGRTYTVPQMLSIVSSPLKMTEENFV